MALAVIAFGGGCGHCVFVKRKLKGIFARVLLVIFCAAFLMASASLDTGLAGVDTATTELEVASSSGRPGSRATRQGKKRTSRQGSGYPKKH